MAAGTKSPTTRNPRNPRTPGAPNGPNGPDGPESRDISSVARHLTLVYSAPREVTGLPPVQPPDRFDATEFAEIQTATCRVRDVVTLTPPARGLRRAVLTHGLATGAAVDADALTMLLVVKAHNHPVPLELFTEDMVWKLLWVDVFAWCSQRRIAMPDAVAETLWTLLTYLDAAGDLHVSSDPLDELYAPLRSSAGLGDDGVARHPAARRKGARRPSPQR